jgi:Zn-dependent peptidase ImmA (M78 family)
LRLPFLVLFLDSPPELDAITIPDLRTVGNRVLAKPSLDFVETLNDAYMRQDWFRDYLASNGGTALHFVGKFSTKDAPSLVAEDMRAVLGLDTAFRAVIRDWEDLIKGLTINAENAGILVMRSGCAGHATSRKLDVNEFRGFALCDSMAPLVFINGQDSRAAQNFTLAHELVHIWIGKSGVSNVLADDDYLANQDIVEAFCNQVAAELLVPLREFHDYWDDDDSIWVNMRRIVTRFKVSSLVALIRALDAQVIQYPAFKSAFDREVRRATKQEREDDAKGGQFWNTFPWRVSRLLSHTLAEAVRSERTTYSEAASLLRINVSSFETYLHQEIGT